MRDKEQQDSAQPTTMLYSVLSGLQHLFVNNTSTANSTTTTKAILVNVVNSNDHHLRGGNELILSATPKIGPNFIITPPMQATHPHLNSSLPTKKNLNYLLQPQNNFSSETTALVARL